MWNIFIPFHNRGNLGVFCLLANIRRFVVTSGIYGPIEQAGRQTRKQIRDQKLTLDWTGASLLINTVSGEYYQISRQDLGNTTPKPPKVTPKNDHQKLPPKDPKNDHTK